MKISKFDIGAEIISILTKGMYPDPRDAVREYIQNAIDAGSKSVDIKVRQNSVIVEDDGSGMDYSTLRKAVRVGVSDKKPGKDIGFMGIGIYSSFHLCDTLLIFTRKKGKLPQSLEMDFKGMRILLEQEREKRLSEEIKSEDLTSLQSLLEEYIKVPEEDSVAEEEYPIEESGTRVELIGLNPVLDDLLNNFDDLSNYLQDVVPLHFNKEKFKWAEQIESKINKVSKDHKAKFELINLKLQVGSQIESLYRPYTDDIFTNNISREPDFVEIKNDGVFLGLAWGCLNSSRDRIILPKKDERNRNLRGFIIKKQGFSIGNREDLSKYFGPSNTYYHRYTGEVIIVNNQILPNAARNDIEASDLKKILFYQIQTKVVPYYVGIASKFQEEDVARDVLKSQGSLLKDILGQYNPYEDNFNVYIDQIGRIDSIVEKVLKKIKKLKDDELKKEAQNLLTNADTLKKEITSKFKELTSKKRTVKKVKSVDPTLDVAINLSSYTVDSSVKYENILEVLETLDIELNADLLRLFEIIDEMFIQSIASSKTDYYKLLNQLKDEYENEG